MRGSRSYPHPHPRRAFTLIELLVVIAIVAILAVVVVLVINPGQLLAQSRDATRLSDMATLQSGISLYQTDLSGTAGFSLGAASTSYLSVPDSSATCANLGLPAAPGGYVYDCSPSSAYRNASSTGWLPLNFQKISSGAPFGTLPVDPVNQTSSDLYYTYQTNGSQYVMSALLESQKYAKNAAATGGIDPGLYEAGTAASTLPDVGRGLTGYWPLNEGGLGNIAADWSGAGANGTWQGSGAGTSGYYSPGKLWAWAGTFNGSTNYLLAATGTLAAGTAGSITAMGWVYPKDFTSPHTVFPIGDSHAYQSGSAGWAVSEGYASNGIIVVFNDGVHLVNGAIAFSAATPPSSMLNAWSQVAVVFDRRAGRAYAYLNGVLQPGSVDISSVTGNVVMNYNFGVGYMSGWYFNGYMNDVRVYGRALSANEIQDIYNAEK